jgi:hypothetical protein
MNHRAMWGVRRSLPRLSVAAVCTSGYPTNWLVSAGRNHIPEKKGTWMELRHAS